MDDDIRVEQRLPKAHYYVEDDSDVEKPTVSKKSEFFPVFHLQPSDLFILLVLTFVSFWTRIYRIEFPEEVVFDELYFGGFTNKYIKRTFFFDIHPPLAKLIIYSMASAF
jgi:dolichyl-phosphate-mannose-protein mannosyltransferase